MHCKTTLRVACLLATLLVLGLAAAGAQGAEVRSRAEGDALLTAQPDNPGTYMTYAEFLVDIGDLTRASSVLESGRETAEPSADLLLALGRVYRDRQLWVEAKTAADEALDMNGEDAETYVLLGEIHFGMGWPRAGLENFRQAIEIAPDETMPRVRLVGGLLEDDQVEAAEDQCLRFISEDAENAELWMALARVFEKQGKRREAFATYGQVLSIDPGMARAYARQGKLFCEFGQYAAAEQCCRQALDLDNNDALAHAYLGIALSHLGRADEARQHAEIAEASGLNMMSVWRKLDK